MLIRQQDPELHDSVKAEVVGGAILLPYVIQGLVYESGANHSKVARTGVEVVLGQQVFFDQHEIVAITHSGSIAFHSAHQGVFG
ncbi:hypothetical protein D3C85_1417250 [compost metagenome]